MKVNLPTVNSDRVLCEHLSSMKEHTSSLMMLKIYCAALVVCEIPSIIRLLRGDVVSALSAWFAPGTNDTAEMGAVYASWLTLLCIARTAVISFPESRGVLFSAAAVHAVEIPLYAYLFSRMESVGMLHYGLMGAILINPLFFLQAALKARK
jgi:hypothetical protein